MIIGCSNPDDTTENPIINTTPSEEDIPSTIPVEESVPSTVRVTLYARNRFDPPELNIRPGTTVEVLVDDQFNGIFTVRIVGLDSKTGLADGDIASFTFDEVGQYTIKQVPLYHELNVTVAGERIESAPKPAAVEVRTSDEASLPDRKFSLFELQQYIREFMHKSYDFHSSMDTDEDIYFTSPKTWGIHALAAPMETTDDFIAAMSSPNWDVWKLYNNPESWDDLYPVLAEAQFEAAYPPNMDYFSYKDSDNTYFPEYKFKDYTEDSDEIYIDGFEKAVETAQGTVLQYGVIAMYANSHQLWDSNWKEPLLIYKIPCTKDVIVYYMPEDAGFEDFEPGNLNKEQVMEKWQAYIQKSFQAHKKNIEPILVYCGVNPALFSADDFKPLTKSETKVVRNNKIHYLLYFDHEFTYSGTMERKYADEFILKELNFTFKNLDSESYDGDFSRLLIRVLINDSEDTTHFIDYNLGPVVPGKEYALTKELATTIKGENVTLIFIPAIEITIREVTGSKETVYWVAYPLSHPIIYEPEV